MPPLWRVLLAFVVAPTLVALVLAVVSSIYDGGPYLWERLWRSAILFSVFAVAQGLVVGVPLYLLLRNRLNATPFNCALAGAVVAALPWLVINLLTPGPEYAYGGGHITDQNGHRTLAGWLDIAMSLGWLALMGLCAGLVFWLVAAAGLKRQQATAKP